MVRCCSHRIRLNNFSKGIALISDTSYLQDQLYRNNIFGFSSVMASLLLHLVAFAHLVGGILIMIGLVTRFAAVIQIPILICAILFVNLSNGLSILNSELWLSIIVLSLLVLFWVIGSGPFSVDEQFKKRKWH